jgi:hypothetical protein
LFWFLFLVFQGLASRLIIQIRTSATITMLGHGPSKKLHTDQVILAKTNTCCVFFGGITDLPIHDGQIGGLTQANAPFATWLELDFCGLTA